MPNNDVALLLKTTDGKTLVLTLSPKQFEIYDRLLHSKEDMTIGEYQMLIHTMLCFGAVKSASTSTKTSEEISADWDNKGLSNGDLKAHIVFDDDGRMI